MSPDRYRYTLNRPPRALPGPPHCLVLRCQRWLCNRTFHMALNRPGQPRRFCSPACRVAEHRRLNG
jgi:hypothetical protein